MIVLVKSNEFLKLFTTDDFVSFVSRLESYNPEAQILQYYEGIQKTAKEINKLFDNKQGWTRFSKENVMKIEDIIETDSLEIVSQLKSFVEKRCKFIQNKIKNHISTWIEGSPDWKDFQDCMNFSSNFDLQSKQYEFLKKKNPETYEKAKEYETYVTNLKTFIDAKWNVRKIDSIQILPDLYVSQSIYWEKENETIRQVIQINDKEISYTRDVNTIPNWNYKN